jgi:hypothetical protein
MHSIPLRINIHLYKRIVIPMNKPTSNKRMKNRHSIPTMLKDVRGRAYKSVYLF